MLLSLTMARVPEAKRLYCPHCDLNIAKSTWYHHYSQYYNPATDVWKTANKSLESDFQFDTSSDEGDENIVLPTENFTDFNDDTTEMVFTTRYIVCIRIAITAI